MCSSDLLPWRRGRRTGGACLATDPADEDVGRICSQRAVVRRIELVDRVSDPGIGDDQMRIAAGTRLPVPDGHDTADRFKSKEYCGGDDDEDQRACHRASPMTDLSKRRVL